MASPSAAPDWPCRCLEPAARKIMPHSDCLLPRCHQPHGQMQGLPCFCSADDGGTTTVFETKTFSSFLRFRSCLRLLFFPLGPARPAAAGYSGATEEPSQGGTSISQGGQGCNTLQEIQAGCLLVLQPPHCEAGGHGQLHSSELAVMRKGQGEMVPRGCRIRSNFVP